MLQKQVASCLILPLLVLISGCEKKGEITAPEVGQVFTQVIHYHPSFLEKHPGHTATGSLFSQATFRVSDPDGLDDLNMLAVEDINNGLSYELVNRLPHESIGVHYQNTTNLFFDVFEADGLDRIELNNWQVSAIDLQGYTSHKAFEYALFDGVQASTEQFVFSPDYLGLDTGDGVAAMEAMTQADNSISFTDNGTSFTISFDVSDSRASNYAIWFYDQSALTTLPSDIVTLEDAAKGILDSDSGAIVSNPIIFGQTTTLTVNWSDIDLDSNVLSSSLDGMHIVLYDDPLDSFISASRAWFSQAGISEYISLTP